ncbi:MAG TPA: response regulator [Candidatus Obscuribacterales bacterium]
MERVLPTVRDEAGSKPQIVREKLVMHDLYQFYEAGENMQPEPKANVLLVDDHPENLLALEAILSRLGQNLVQAPSGEEALRCLLNQDFAVILLDVQMPGMDGFETAELIRSRERSRHTPIIFLTAFSSNDKVVSKGYSLGAVDYLHKPIEPEILLSKVTVFVDLFNKTEEVKRQATQLAAVNAELRTSEERFRSLSACSPVGIFLSDISGRCTYTNPRCQVICGFTLQESLQQGWLPSVHPEDRDRVFAKWAAYTREGRQYSDEFRFQTPAGVIRWTHVRSSPMLSDKGELLGHVGTIEDITEHKQAEEARAEFIREQEARRQAEAANRMKDEFLATLSHELRTPLNSMLGWAKLLRTRKFDEITTARALETIERNAKLQAQLIEDILDVSRIIRGKLRLNLHPVNLIPVIDAAIDSVRLASEAKAIELKSVVDATVDLVSGDSARLQQVVWNLLTNAIKFTPEGGKVEVWLEQVRAAENSQVTPGGYSLTESSALHKSTYAQIKVIDTGIGISRDFLPYIFDRFRQADSTTTRSQGGLGLGLAIVRQLVELHGGSIHVDSEGEGRGAIFTVRLPLETNNLNQDDAIEGGVVSHKELAMPRSSPSECVNPTSLDGLQVLIVDDNSDTLDFLTTILEESGAKARAATSVSQALNTLENFKPDVVVSDIGMPEQDGYELIRQVRAMDVQQGGNVPAIALTAYAMGEERTRAIQAGFQMHLAKPVEPSELIAGIAKLAQSQRNFSERV